MRGCPPFVLVGGERRGARGGTLPLSARGGGWECILACASGAAHRSRSGAIGEERTPEALGNKGILRAKRGLRDNVKDIYEIFPNRKNLSLSFARECVIGI